MSFDGFFQFGGVEIVNAKRTTDYVRNLAGGLPLVRRTTIYDTLNAVLGDAPYRTPFLDGASWVETDPPSDLDQTNPTHNFYGFYPLEIMGIGDSTMAASVTEALGDGGFVNSSRDASRSIKFHGILLAGDMLSAEHGLTWLRNALKGNGCGMHGGACGFSDLRYFLASPDVCDPSFNTDFTAHTADEMMGSLDVSTSPITFYPNTDGSPIRLQWLFDNADGAIIRWGTEALDGPEVFQSLGPIQVRRTNFVPNPSFTNDVLNWVTGSATLTRINDGIDEPYARADQSASPVTYRSNWLPDPSFENGDPNTMGWRGSGDIVQTADGTAPNGTHVAVVAADAGGNWMEATMLGPYDSGTTGTFSFYKRHTSNITVTIKDNTGLVIFTHTFTGLANAWERINVTGVPMKLNYTIRIETDGSQELRTDAFLLEAAVSMGTFFTGDSGAGYSYVGASPANASRFASGTNTAFHIETPNTTAPVGPMMATFLMRSVEASPSVTVELVDPVGTVLGAALVQPGPVWTRYALGVPFGGQAKLRFTSSTGYFDTDEVMYEAGALVNPYFDGSFPTPDGYTLVWLGAPNASPSRMDWTGTTLLESSPAVRFYLSLDAGKLQAVTARSWWPERISVDDQMEPYDRTYHNVYTVQGVQRIKDYQFDSGAGIEVDFILQAEVPFPFSTQGEDIPFIADNAMNYSDPRAVATNLAINPNAEGLGAASTEATNLVTNPAAEATGASTIAFTNLVTNPSCETNATGYTAIPGTTGVAAITQATAASTPYGTHTAKCTWSTASTAAGGGMSYDVAVTAGQIYSFGINFLRSSIANNLVMQVEWRTASTTVSTSAGSSFGVTATQITLATLSNLTAPATATIARIKVISTTGGSFAQWSIGATLEFDGVIAVNSAFLPPNSYFDGTTALTDFTFAWTGTAHASTSTMSYTALVSSWAAANVGHGGTMIGYASTLQPFAGTRSAKVLWTTAATTAGGGLEVGSDFSIPAVAGDTYFGTAEVLCSKAQSMILQLRFFDNTNTQVGSSVNSVTTVVGANTWTSITVSAVAPAGAVSVWLVAEGASTGTVMNAGDFIQVDSILVADSAYTLPYFDGSVASSGDYTYSWSGTTNASTSLRKVLTLSGNLGANASSDGATLFLYASTIDPYLGTHCAKVLFRTAATTPRGGIVLGSTGTNGPVVVAATPYTGGGWVRSNIAQKVAAEVTFYDHTGTAIGSATVGTPVTLVPSTWQFVSVTAIAPAGAVACRIFYTGQTGGIIWSPGDWLKVDAMMVASGFYPTAYFDGSTVDTTAMIYAWTGATNGSTSTATVVPSTVASIIDPDLPTLPTPPVAPAIPDIALTNIMDWTRYFLTIPKGNVAEWASTIPTLTLLTKTTEARQVRVRFYPNPFEWDQDNVDPTAYCGEFLLSYLPGNSQVVVDGVSRSASANVAGTGTQPASQLLYGTDGGPMTWPELSCGIGYLMTVDVPPTADIDNLELQLVVTRQE